jgi:predicted ATP-grasp superfamily ATP-dependent carboligase
MSLVGVSRLLTANAPGPRFGYGGAIGAVVLSQELETQFKQMGRTVGQEFALRGLWGMDFIHDGFRAWATEVNPRYTATVELYEHAYGKGLLPFHRRACESWRSLPGGSRHLGIFDWDVKPAVPRSVGKVVIYADRDLLIPPWGGWSSARDAMLSELMILADRPTEGSVLSRGVPVCTLFASGRTENECRALLNHRGQELQTHFR